MIFFSQPNYGRLTLFASHGVASATYFTMNSRPCHIEQRLSTSLASLTIFTSYCFFLNPFADVCRAIRELHALRFANRQKTHGVAIHEFHLFQIQSYV